MSTERETRYAEALRRADDEALEGTNFGRLTATYDEAARAVMAVADEERAADRAEIERLRSGARELGRILDRSLRDALDASGRHDVIGEDGDGDWAVVWETLAELRPRAEAAEARLDALVADLRGLPESWARVVHERYCGAPPSCGLSDRSSCEGTAGSDEIRLLRKALRAVLDKHAGEVRS
jgi:hypothetical protein